MNPPIPSLRPCLAAVLILGGLAGSTHAAVVWDESVDGDLSGSGLEPTALSLSVGMNSVIATSSPGDREYLTFEVPTGHVLEGVELRSYVGLDEVAFFAIQNGSTFTEPPVGTTVGNLLGYSHFGPGSGIVGDDILPSVGTGPGSQGFTPPLLAGDYSIWMQQVGLPSTYQLDFVIAAVPEPAESALWLASALGVAAGFRRWHARTRS